MPIASMTKLMAALVAADMLEPDTVIPIRDSVLLHKGVSGNFMAGETVTLIDALHAMLISSNNEITNAVAEVARGDEVFIREMNNRARALGLFDTYFVNPTGLDGDSDSEIMNYATASDVARLMRYIFENRSDIFSILKKESYTITTGNTNRKVVVQTTNALLPGQGAPLAVIGGKTGHTPKSKMNLATVFEPPNQSGKIISVIIGSENSFSDTQKLMRYVEQSFLW